MGTEAETTSWSGWYRAARELMASYGVRRLARDTYRQHFLAGDSVGAACAQIRAAELGGDLTPKWGN